MAKAATLAVIGALIVGAMVGSGGAILLLTRTRVDLSSKAGQEEKSSSGGAGGSPQGSARREGLTPQQLQRMNFASPMKGRERFGERSESIRNVARVALRNMSEAAELADDINEMLDIIDNADHAAWTARLSRNGIGLGEMEADPGYERRWSERARDFAEAVKDWNGASLQIESEGGLVQWCEGIYPTHMAVGEVGLFKRPGFLMDYQTPDVKSVVLTVEMKWVLDGELEPRFNRVGFRFVRWKGSNEWMLTTVAFARDSGDAPFLLPPI